MICKALGNIALVAMVAASGCGNAETGMTESMPVVRVNGQLITLQQVRQVVGEYAGSMSPDELRQASRTAIEHLIDEELLVQGALTSRLNSEPTVQRLIEDQRRRILALSYLDKTAPEAPKYSNEEIHHFYNEHPALFKQRRIYLIHGLYASIPAEKTEQLKTAVANATRMSEVARWLTIQKATYRETVSTWSGEDIPGEILPMVEQMRESEMSIVTSPDLVLVLQLIHAKDAAMSEAQASPLIEEILSKRWRTNYSAAEIRRLRGTATIEYLVRDAPLCGGASAHGDPQQPPGCKDRNLEPPTDGSSLARSHRALKYQF